MKKDLVHLTVALLTLVFAGALEELLPNICGVGLPFLLSAAAYCAVTRPPVEGLIFAIAAGAMEDSLSLLPFATSISFFVGMFAVLRGFKLHIITAIVAYSLYQFWGWIWLGSRLQGSLFTRMLVSLPVGALVLVTCFFILRWLDGKAAMNEK